MLAEAVAAHRRVGERRHQRARPHGQGVGGGHRGLEGGIFVVGLGLALEGLEGGPQRRPAAARPPANAPRKSSMRPMRWITVRECGRLMLTYRS